MDAFSTGAIGIKNVFASGGIGRLTGPKIKEYLLDVPEIILLFDADNPGRKASGLIQYEPTDAKKTNIPDIMRQCGYTGIIKIAELSLTDNHSEKDAEGLIIAGKRDVVIKAIQEAREYIPPQRRATENPPLKWDCLSLKRVTAIIKKLTKNLIEDKEPDDVQKFISAILKSVRNKDKKDVEKALIEWGATKEQINAENNISPYILIEFSWKYELSKYLQRTIKVELTPASELLKRIKHHKPIIDIDYEKVKKNKNVIQYFETLGVRAAALIVSDILHGRVIYVESEKLFYFFNDHTWRRVPDVTGIIYNILASVVVYFYENVDFDKMEIKKETLEEIVTGLESRRYRVEIMSEFSQLEDEGVFKTSVLFDGSAICETLTLIDGVMDFSGKEIIYRKSRSDEYRRDILPYTIGEIKKAIKPKEYMQLMNGNFEDADTLESLLFYLSLIISRNTKFKYGAIFIGETNTGKTVTMDILNAALPNMIEPIPSEILISRGKVNFKSGNEATPFLANLEGKGCGLSSETARNLSLNTAFWKQITGGDLIPSRGLYEKARKFTSTAQMIILTNYLPFFDNHDKAVIDRLVIIPFLIQHKKGDKKTIDIEEFKKRIKNENPGIVKLLAEYYIKLKQEYRGAIPFSNICKKYKAIYLEELDTDISRFVKECVIFDVENSPYIEIKLLYHEFLKFNNLTPDTAGKDTISQNAFTRYLKRDYKEVIQKQKKVNNEVLNCFFNVRLKTDTERWSEMPQEPEKQNKPADDDVPF